MNRVQESPVIACQAARAGWRANPVIYEINAWVWLNQLSRKHGRPIDLATVPERELEALASWRFDAIWLMGVWHRGEATRQSALNYLHEYRGALPDITEADVPGSAFAICDYRVEDCLGGRDGLASFRQRLRRHGLKLILDFVPNHVATDHHWLFEHPEYFVQGTAHDIRARPDSYFEIMRPDGQQLIIARGRDPYFPAWIDTAQLNAFDSGLRRTIIETLIDIGHQCDGLRCDMAMLMTNEVFARTWRAERGAAPATEFWREIIPAVRQVHPQMLFMAEVYWDMEHELQSQHFDYTYDKRMYDRLTDGDITAIKTHLSADMAYLRSNIRFIENHDEARAMQAFGEDQQKPAATLICTLPGAALLHQGQMEGWRVKLPVQINRGPVEAELPLLSRFYRRLLREARHALYHRGRWRVLSPRAIHAGDHTFSNLIAYAWSDADDLRLVVVNLSAEWSRAAIALDESTWLADRQWLLAEVLSQSFARHSGDDLIERGLQLEVPPFGAHIFRFEPEASQAQTECDAAPAQGRESSTIAR